MPIKLVICCSNHLFGEGIKRLLDDYKDVSVLGIFFESIDFKKIIKLNPDIIIADFSIFRDFYNDFASGGQIKILLIEVTEPYALPYTVRCQSVIPHQWR